MYESLAASGYDHVVCVVMTGMGADGTVGIRTLKAAKKTYVIAQNQETSTVYGMPKSVVAAGLSSIELPLDEIAQEIVLCAGVR
jgi:two-component system chemotaxis response regulator CheB